MRLFYIRFENRSSVAIWSVCFRVPEYRRFRIGLSKGRNPDKLAQSLQAAHEAKAKYRPRSSSGPGRRTFSPVTGVRIPYGVFFFWERLEFDFTAGMPKFCRSVSF